MNLFDIGKTISFVVIFLLVVSWTLSDEYTKLKLLHTRMSEITDLIEKKVLLINSLDTQMNSLTNRVGNLENSIDGLNERFDLFVKIYIVKNGQAVQINKKQEDEYYQKN